MIIIVDTGGANLASVMNALARLERPATLTADPDTIFRASHVLFPGVGAAGDSMDRLRGKELLSCLRELKQPTLGICLGMQLLFGSSEEGDTECLGVLPGRVTKLVPRAGLPVPHMGWNRLRVLKPESPLFAGIGEESYFYFVHSFKAPQGEWVSAGFEYGGLFPAMVERGNYFGVQFHPEKSGKAGARILESFLRL